MNKIEITMNAWLQSGRSNTFIHVCPDDVVFRTSGQQNSLVIGNGILPYGHAAIYVASNCIGINCIPDTSSAADTRIVLDIGGTAACRSGMTWCYPNTPAVQAQNGCNGCRASVSGLVLHDGRKDTVRLDRGGLIQTSGSISGSNAVLGRRVGQSTQSGQSGQSGPSGQSTRSGQWGHTEVLTVFGKGAFDNGVCLLVEPDQGRTDGRADKATITFDRDTSVMSVGAYATLDSSGLLINGTISSSGQMFAPGYRIISDARLKHDVVGSDRDSDLRDVMAMDVRRFTLADNGADRGSGRQMGVLAHELSSIVPDAVSRVQDYLPDVMCRAVIEGRGRGNGRGRGVWIVFPQSFAPHVFKVGDNIRMRLDCTVMVADVIQLDSKDSRRVCIEVCATGRRALCDAESGTSVFVFGTLCHDILAVDTNHLLFKLVSAVQRLNTKLEDMQVNDVPRS